MKMTQDGVIDRKVSISDWKVLMSLNENAEVLLISV